MSDLWTRKRYPRFAEGEVVALTQDAIRKNIKGRGSIYGVAWPSPKGRLSIRVRRIGQVMEREYWIGFWRHLTPADRPFAK
jgi:hypothetical protein